MTAAQRKAVQSHRSRLQRCGLVRAEVQIPAGDAALMRALAAALRADGGQAKRVRTAVRRALQTSDAPSILDLLACDLPDEPFDSLLKRPRDMGRDVEL
jgi:hypothetical protein